MTTVCLCFHKMHELITTKINFYFNRMKNKKLMNSTQEFNTQNHSIRVHLITLLLCLWTLPEFPSVASSAYEAPFLPRLHSPQKFTSAPSSAYETSFYAAFVHRRKSHRSLPPCMKHHFTSVDPEAFHLVLMMTNLWRLVY